MERRTLGEKTAYVTDRAHPLPTLDLEGDTMKFWESGLVLNALMLCGLLVGAGVLRRFIPPLRKLGIPGSIIAGVLGLVLGTQVLDVVPLDIELLESVVYHGLAVVFIAISLQTPTPSGKSGGALSFSIGVPFMIALQGVIGLGLVLALGLTVVDHMHPGFGLLLPLGFEQGPGQALALGAAWEAGGMPDGSAVGLIIAAIGFGWSVLLGVPLVAWGRKRGLFKERQGDHGDGPRVRRVDEPRLPAGAVELLTRQIAAVAVVYLVTYGFVSTLASALSDTPGIAAMAWGFHFVFGAVFAIGARALINRLPGGSPLHDATLGRIAGTTVDVLTCAALAAVQVAVFKSNWVVILAVTTAGGIVTLVSCVWIGRRAFPDAPFEHVIVWFGISTGTLPMGLALLRIIDPELEGPAPLNAVLGSAGALVFGAPIMLVMLPMAVKGWPDDYPSSGWLGLAMFAGYALFLLGVWRWKGALRFSKPTEIWPEEL